MAGAYVTMDEAAVQRLLTGPDGPVGRDLLKRGVRVERTAKHLCPVLTGRLRSSLTHELGHDSKGLCCFVGTNVDYGVYVELGTRHQRAKPYLRPALRSAGGKSAA